MATLPAGLKMEFVTSSTRAPQLARVKFAAFNDNPLNALMYPVSSSNKSETIAWLEERERRQLSNKTKNKNTTIVAIVDTANHDEIVACAKWKIPPRFSRLLDGDISSGAQPEQDGVSNDTEGKPNGNNDKLPPYPEGANIPLQTHFRAMLDDQRTRYYEPDNDYMLGTLYTLPTYQGRGCASAILSWGTRQADMNGANIYLESSPSAHGLYSKHGWQDVDESEIDLSQFGGDGMYPLTIMVRDPSRSES